MRYILVFLFILSVFTPNFSCQAENIDDFTLFFSKWSDKINYLMQNSQEALNDKLSGKNLQDFTRDLEAIKEDADKLQEKLKEKGISSLNDLQNQANLKSFLEILRQITNILEDIKKTNLEKSISESQKMQAIFEESLKPPPIVKADFNNIDNLIEDVKSQTQLLAKTCFQAFLKNVPSSFCWKKGLDFGTIPKNCPTGYIRNLAICHTPCKEGYHFTLLSCWETCPSDYSDIGLFCKKSWRLKLKKTYVPSMLTNFDKRVECDSGMYKFGALCYRDCAQKKLANCGSGACATDKGGCYEGILQITVNFLLGAGKFVDFILSTQNDANLQDATSQLQDIINKIGRKFLDKAYEHVKNWIADDNMKDFMVSSMINFTTKFIGEKFSQYLNNSMIARICNKVHEEAASQIINSSQPDLSFSGINLADLKGTITECLNVDLSNNDPNDELLCIRKALQTAAGVDVTGISAMAAAFMNPVCDI